MKELFKILFRMKRRRPISSWTYSQGVPSTVGAFSIILVLFTCTSSGSAASISGHVYDIVTGQALAGRIIVAESIDSVPRDSFPGNPMQGTRYDTITGTDGRYSMGSLPSGRYLVYENASESEFPEIIDTRAESDHDSIDIWLTVPDRDTFAVSGNVRLLESYIIISMGDVIVFSASGQIIGHAFLMPDDSLPYDPSDTIYPWFKPYEIGNLPRVPSKVSVCVFEYLPQFYDHTYLADTDAGYILPPRKEVNFDLELGGDIFSYSGGISGVISGPHGPLSYASVFARKEGRLINGTISGFDGYYELYGLEPGTYTIYASRPGYASTSHGGTITIADQWEDGIDVTLPPAPGIEEPDALPGQGLAVESFPNPFAASTSIRFSLPNAGPLSLKIYDASGSLVRTLAEGSRQAGTYTLQWDARDSKGQALPSGVYFATLERPGNISSKRLVLIR